MDSKVMTEYNLQLIASLKIIWLACFGYLYGLGGISNKWIRRFIAPAWMMLGIFSFSQWQGVWSYWYLLFYPIAVIGLHRGYGSDKTMVKVYKRAVYGLILSCASIPIVAHSHYWFLFALSCFISVLSCVVIGAFDAPRNARDNETLIATFCFLLTLFLI